MNKSISQENQVNAENWKLQAINRYLQEANDEAIDLVWRFVTRMGKYWEGEKEV